jgi:hypothetical protein
MNAPGWFSEENLRKRASVVADVETWAWGAMGEVLHNLLSPVSQPGPPWTHTFVPPESAVLTSSDPQPPPGTVVRDDLGRTWELCDEAEGGLWWRTDADDDPESWTKIAGNYGPVTVLEWGESAARPVSIMDVKKGDLIEVMRGVCGGGSGLYRVTSAVPSEDGSGVTIRTEPWTGEAAPDLYRSEILPDTGNAGCYFP